MVLVHNKTNKKSTYESTMNMTEISILGVQLYTYFIHLLYSRPENKKAVDFDRYVLRR